MSLCPKDAPRVHAIHDLKLTVFVHDSREDAAHIMLVDSNGRVE